MWYSMYLREATRSQPGTVFPTAEIEMPCESISARQLRGDRPHAVRRFRGTNIWPVGLRRREARRRAQKTVKSELESGPAGLGLGEWSTGGLWILPVGTIGLWART